MGDGLIFTSSGFGAPALRTVRTGGQGDVTATHIAWEQQRGVPMEVSPLYRKPYLYTVTSAGIATCLQAATGEVVYQERLGGKYSASPVYADGRIYFLSESGETVVIAPARNSKSSPEIRCRKHARLRWPCPADGSSFARTSTCIALVHGDAFSVPIHTIRPSASGTNTSPARVRDKPPNTGCAGSLTSHSRQRSVHSRPPHGSRPCDRSRTPPHSRPRRA